MDADELYLKSKRARQEGLTARTFNALLRAEFGSGESGEYSHRQPPLDRSRILAAVEDGSIWNVREIGSSAVREICKWLVKPPP